MNDQTAQRVLEIDGVMNFRDIGGYVNRHGKTVRWAKCYRSAQLDGLTKKGIADMSALNIQTVIDLRFVDESVRYPTVLAGFKNAEFIAWQDQSHDTEVAERSSEMQLSWKDSLESNDPVKVREAMRVNYPKKLYSHRVIYRTLLLKIIDGQTPLVFHCAAGKDRTGVAAALILSLVNVADDIIVQDYLLTQQEIAGMAEFWMSGGAVDNANYSDFQSRLLSKPKDVLRPIFEADITYINTLLEYVNLQYGGFERYALEKLQLTTEQLEQLRAQLLT